MAITVLCGKDGAREASPWRTAGGGDGKAPPSYQQSEWLFASRQRNVRKRQSAASLRDQESAPRIELLIPSSSIAELPDEAASVSDDEHATGTSDLSMSGPDLDDSASLRSYSSPATVASTPDLVHRRPTGWQRHRSWLAHQSGGNGESTFAAIEPTLSTPPPLDGLGVMDLPMVTGVRPSHLSAKPWQRSSSASTSTNLRNTATLLELQGNNVTSCEGDAPAGRPAPIRSGLLNRRDRQRSWLEYRSHSYQ